MPKAAAIAESLEAAVAAFEAARLGGAPARIVEYLPKNKRDRARYACELARVDLEIADTLGEPRSVEDYRATAPEIFESPELLGEVAFEEYRLALARGERLTVEGQLARYGLERRHWPTPLEAVGQAAVLYPAAGEQFDGMPLERLLGTGAFSRVFVARQPKFGMRPIALKLTAAASVEPERLGRLQHTNIVPIYSAHYDRGLLGVAMPLLGERTFADLLAPARKSAEVVSTVRADANADRTLGDAEQVKAIVAPSLEHLVTSAGKLDWRWACELIAGIAAGLAHAHGRGIVHGDIKPANLLLGDDGAPRLLDFNLASDTAGRAPATLVVGGTLPYLAPEHLLSLVEGQRVTAACDQYSLGVVLYELLARSKPFPQRSGEFEDSIRAMREDRRVAPRLPEDCGASLGVRAIVGKCLDPDPAKRYASVAELEEELRRELADEPLRRTPEVAWTHELAKWRRRHAGRLSRLAAVAAAVVAVAAIVLAGSWRERSASLAARDALARFEADALTARMTFSLPQLETDLRESGIAAAEKALMAVASDAIRTRLTAAEQGRVQATAGELLALAERHGGSEALDVVAQTAGVELHARKAGALAEAQGLLQAGRFKDAAELLRAATDEDPRDPALWLQSGIAEAGAGRPSRAYASLTAAAALQPEAGVVRRTMASLYMDQGEYEEALAELDRVPAEGQAEKRSVEMNRALALMGLGRHAEAERAASAAIEAGLSRPRSYLLRARCRATLGNYEGALADREEACRATPVDDADWAARAIVLEQDSPEAALGEVRQGLEQFPQSVVLLRNELHLVGDVFKRRDEALAIARRLSEAIPDDIPAKLGEAVCLASLGQIDEALKLADRVAASVDRPLDRLQLGCVYALCSAKKPELATRAVECVAGAIAAEPALALRAARDPDLLTLRADERFVGVLRAAATLSGAP